MLLSFKIKSLKKQPVEKLGGRKMEKFDEVAKIIEEVADIPVDEIENDSSLIDDLDLSSLEIMTILNNVSRKFGVKITEQQTLEIETVGDIVKVL